VGPAARRQVHSPELQKLWLGVGSTTIGRAIAVPPVGESWSPQKLEYYENRAENAQNPAERIRKNRERPPYGMTASTAYPTEPATDRHRRHPYRDQGERCPDQITPAAFTGRRGERDQAGTHDD
jgi:hypothetical protein